MNVRIFAIYCSYVFAVKAKHHTTFLPTVKIHLILSPSWKGALPCVRVNGNERSLNCRITRWPFEKAYGASRNYGFNTMNYAVNIKMWYSNLCSTISQQEVLPRMKFNGQPMKFHSSFTSHCINKAVHLPILRMGSKHIKIIFLSCYT